MILKSTLIHIFTIMAVGGGGQCVLVCVIFKAVYNQCLHTLQKDQNWLEEQANLMHKILYACKNTFGIWLKRYQLTIWFPWLKTLKILCSYISF